MKKLMLSLCLCALVVSLCSAADDPVAQLNAIYNASKAEYASLTKEIAKLKTGKKLGADADIARAEKKQQAIVDKLKTVKSDDPGVAELQSTLIAQLKKGRELTRDEYVRAQKTK